MIDEVLKQDLERVLEKRERKRFLKRLQERAIGEGRLREMPAPVTERYSKALEQLGGGVLGILIGLFASIFNFLLFVWLLHMEL